MSISALPARFSRWLASFLIHPWSCLAVLLPALAIETVQHKRVLQHASTKRITLGLAALHLYWFATAFNSNFFVAPMLYYTVPGLDGHQKANVARYRFGWINKVEIIASVVSLDLFLTWRHRVAATTTTTAAIIVSPQQYPKWSLLTAAVLAPAFITAIQTVYFFPKAIAGANTSSAPTMSNRKIRWIQYSYIGLEATKVTSLGVASTYFGNMLAV